MGKDDRFSITPRKVLCKDCGAEVYWAWMAERQKWWSINVEYDLKMGRILLSVNSKDGKITGRKLEKDDPVPDGYLPRTPHYMTCPAQGRAGSRKGKTVPKEKEWKEELDAEAEAKTLEIPF